MNQLVKPVEAVRGSGFLNGFVWRVAEWVTSVSTIHPSTHRLKNALGLTVGMVGGRYIMDKAVGHTPDGMAVQKEDVPLPFRPIHGILNYNPYSDAYSDRMMHVANMWIPAGLGAVGAYLGSYDYAFNEQPFASVAKTVVKNAKGLTLDKAEDAAMAFQSQSMRKLAGGTAMFGSSAEINMIPGPWNYGTNLNLAFQGTVARNKMRTTYFTKLQQFSNSNNHDFAFGPSSMLTRLRNYLLDNPDKIPPDARRQTYAVLEGWFGDRVTAEHVDQFLAPALEARDKIITEGGIPAAQKEAFTKTLQQSLAGEGLERNLMRIGLDPSTAMIGRNGAVEYMSSALGASDKLETLQKAYHSGLLERGVVKEISKEAELLNAATKAADSLVVKQGMLAFGGLALGVMALGYRALSKEKEWWDKEEKPPLAPAEAKSPDAAAQDAPSHRVHKDRSHPTLTMVERVTEGLNAPTTMSMHRSSCALGLTIGGYIGTQVANTLTGRTLGGVILPKAKVPEYLEWMHNKLPYNPASHAPRDKWSAVLHLGIPALFATAGVVTASDLFFKKRRNTVSAEHEYLEDFENRATMAQANTWTPLMALSSLVVAPGGFHLLPLPAPNYGGLLATRFKLAAGRKGVMPGVSELWSGSTAPFAEGPVKLRDRMLKYAINNDSVDPEMMDSFARGIVLQWFPDATPKQVHEFVDKIQQDREQFYQDGQGIPDDLKSECYDVLASHFKDGGLEQTFRQIGLNPLQAVFGNNGLSGKVAEKLASSDELAEIHAEYENKYNQRLSALEKASASQADRPVDHGDYQGPDVKDLATSPGFTTPSTRAHIASVSHMAEHAPQVAG